RDGMFCSHTSLSSERSTSNCSVHPAPALPGCQKTGQSSGYPFQAVNFEYLGNSSRGFVSKSLALVWLPCNPSPTGAERSSPTTPGSPCSLICAVPYPEKEIEQDRDIEGQHHPFRDTPALGQLVDLHWNKASRRKDSKVFGPRPR